MSTRKLQAARARPSTVEKGRPGVLAAAQVAQAPPRPAGAKPATDQGPLMIQVEVVDPEGHRLSGADVVFGSCIARTSGNVEWVLERTRTDGAGHVQLEVARERRGATVRAASVWAYQPGRALATSSVFLRGKASPPVDSTDPE